MDQDGSDEQWIDERDVWVLEALDADGTPTWHWELPGLTDETLADLLGLPDLPKGSLPIPHPAVEDLAGQFDLRIDVERSPAFRIGQQSRPTA